MNKISSHLICRSGLILILLLILTGCKVDMDGLTNQSLAAPTVTPILTEIPAPSWHGITPGKTSSDQVISQLGSPDAVLTEDPYLIYRYCDHEDLGWEIVEIWLQDNGNKTVTTAVFRTIPYYEGWDTIVPTDLLPLLAENGIPDKVTWGTLRWSRYLIWNGRGIAISTSIVIKPSEWDERKAGEILLYEPMPLDEFLAMQWPWPLHSSGFSDRNLFVGGDAPDTFPEDPYDWSTMPTPVP